MVLLTRRATLSGAEQVREIELTAGVAAAGAPVLLAEDAEVLVAEPDRPVRAA